MGQINREPSIEGAFGGLDERIANLERTALTGFVVKSGIVAVEWSAKSVSSATKVVKTGMHSVVAFVGQPVAGLTIQVFNVVSVTGGDVTVGLTGTGESPIGTKVNAYWIAIGK